MSNGGSIKPGAAIFEELTVAQLAMTFLFSQNLKVYSQKVLF